MNLFKIFSNFIFVFVFILAPVFSYEEISYSDHCSSFAPEATPTTPIFTRYPFLEPVTSHYTGGQKILGQDSPSQRSILFTATENLFRTTTIDTYKIQARLSFISSNIYHLSPNLTGSFNRKRLRHRPLVFYLDGFWSVSTNKLCMVGSARWFTKEGNQLKVDAVLKLNFARFISLNTSLVSGILETLSSPNDSNHFEPISMLGFPRVADFKYNYSLGSNEECNSNTQEHSVASIQSLDLCSIFTNQFKTYKLEYQDNQNQDNRSLLSSPSFLSLYTIQCSLEEKKMRFLLEFQDRRYTPYDQSFNPNITLIGDGTWNGTRNELCIVACHILNQSDPMGGAHVGDCSVRLSLWFPAIRSIKNTHINEGRIWSIKKSGENGYFETIKFRSFDHSLENYATKYEFTEIKKVRRVCPKVAKREGDKYPSGYDADMTFDMSVNHGKMVSTGYGVPIFVGNQFYNSYSAVDSRFSPWRAALPSSTTTTATAAAGPLKISYEIIVRLNVSSRNGISSLYSTNNGRVEISAEGLYDPESGQLCMVGCRNFPSRNASFDCEILMRFKFPSSNQKNGSFFITGSIESLREKTDDFYFDRLEIFSLTYTKTEASESLWRMDLEIIMVMVSGTLSCFFIGTQLLHMKKRPEMVPSISVFMMMILTIGYVVPLVLNFEALFSNTRYLQNIPLGTNGGLLEVNEVIVRIVAMVAFVLQFRLLQLTWTARNHNNNEKNHWNDEIWSLVMCLPMYLIGGLVILLMKMINDDYDTASERSMWGDLRLYGGLTLDGFLFPQIILNFFKISKGNALCCWFYIGNTFVRLLPHGYDLYRGQKNISRQFDRFYLYANPRAGFYSPSWDVFIACGGVVFAVIVFLQQRFGGRFMLPERFQEPIEYEIVPVAIDE